jgi:carbonic anhydrase
MEKLVEGIHRFRSKITRHQAQKLRKLSKGQNPLAMMITCADSRIIPNLIMQTDPGDLFILRNVGNIVPPHGTTNNGEAAAIEFAVGGLGVRDIIVCGHTHCGAMKGLLKPELLKDLPTTRDWLKHAAATQAATHGDCRRERAGAAAATGDHSDRRRALYARRPSAPWLDVCHRNR